MLAETLEAALMEGSEADQDHLQFSLAPTPAAVRDAHIRISSWMAERRIDSVLRSNAEIVLGEALNNVVEHAFADSTHGPEDSDAIRLDLRSGTAALRICIRDRGARMPGLMLPRGQLPALSGKAALLPEGGFGWFLIRELAGDLVYRRQNGWNRLDLVIGNTAAREEDPGAGPEPLSSRSESETSRRAAFSGPEGLASLADTPSVAR